MKETNPNIDLLAYEINKYLLLFYFTMENKNVFGKQDKNPEDSMLLKLIKLKSNLS